MTLGDTGLGHGVGLGDKWGHWTGTSMVDPDAL